MHVVKFSGAIWCCILLIHSNFCQAQEIAEIPFECKALEEEGDWSAKMVSGINSFLREQTTEVAVERQAIWERASKDDGNWAHFKADQRDFLKKRLGMTKKRSLPAMEGIEDPMLASYATNAGGVRIQAVRWEVYEGLMSEGLYLRPEGAVKAQVVLIPDAEMTPEVLAGMAGGPGNFKGLAYRMAKSGIEVLIPALVDRSDRYSGSAILGRYTNQPHREWLYRQAYVLGRHIIGDEIQKVLSAVDWYEKKNSERNINLPIGLAGYGEGGLLALYAGAIDGRVKSTLVSGYFENRKDIYQEPIYRNTFGIFKEMGDAEIAALHAPGFLTLEHCEFPEVSGPPAARAGRSGAAPGAIRTPDFSEVEAEYQRALRWSTGQGGRMELVDAFQENSGQAFSVQALELFLSGLEVKGGLWNGNENPQTPASWVSAHDRQKRLVRNMESYYQGVLDTCEQVRERYFWNRLDHQEGTDLKVAKSALRNELWSTLGRLPDPTQPLDIRARLVESNDKWTRYEVVLPVWKDVFAWGLLVVPTDIKKGERRPVVVCQHGLEGLPEDVVNTDPGFNKFPTYKGFATRLAERGFVTFSPHHPYRGEDNFRVLQRMANPLGYSLFSIMIGQHQRILEWLEGLNFVDPDRIGFYGLSYGGKSAMRIPAVLEKYALSICSGDFNEWIRKNASTKLKYSYMFTKEYEIPEWNLGQTFNYAEMAALIAPRGFMVEYGYLDGIGSVDWINYEFGKVRKHYALTGNAQKLRKEFFVGIHEINENGTYQFLDELLMK